MQEQLWKNIVSVRETSPLVQSITNYVVMNNTANALLSIGASPIMAHAHKEMDDMVSIVNALVINIGTLDEYWVESMRMAIRQAISLNKPWVLDPVGAGATPYRNEVLKELLAFRPTVIRGNASEIMALSANSATVTKGVDSTHQSNEAMTAALRLNGEFGSTVCISGETDIIVREKRLVRLSNGHPMMSKVTGLGCTATAMIGAFVAVNPNSPLEATASAMALLGVAGELAARTAAGPGSLQSNILDILYNISETQFSGTLKISVHER